MPLVEVDPVGLEPFRLASTSAMMKARGALKAARGVHRLGELVASTMSCGDRRDLAEARLTARGRRRCRLVEERS
jgi:hypothetical protein